ALGCPGALKRLSDRLYGALVACSNGISASHNQRSTNMNKLSTTVAAVVITCAIAGPAFAQTRSKINLMPGETYGVWCLDKVASALKKKEDDDTKVFRPADGLTCPGDEDNSISINATELRLGSSATCKLTGVSTRHPDRFGFQCRSNRDKNATW